MKNTAIVSFAFFTFLVCFIAGELWFIRSLQSQPLPEIVTSETVQNLSMEEVISFSESSMVAVVQRISGSVTFPQFTLSNNATIISKLPESPQTFSFDKTYSGIGNILDENGHILTTSSIVSWESLKRDVAKELAKNLTRQSVQTNTREIEMAILNHLKSKGTFTLDKKVLVSPLGKTLPEIANYTNLPDHVYEARILSVNDLYWVNNEDVALLKIDADHLPNALFATQSEEEFDVYIPKIYPQQINEEATVSNTPNYIQKKISSPSKETPSVLYEIPLTDTALPYGTPLFNASGEVVALTIFNDSPRTQQSALPSTHLLEIIEKHAFAPLPEFSIREDALQQYAHGILYAQNQQCEKALFSMRNLEKISTNFLSTDINQSIHSTITNCKESLAQKTSINTAWDEWKNEHPDGKNLFWILPLSLCVAYCCVVLIIWILQKKSRGSSFIIKGIREEKHVNPKTTQPKDVLKKKKANHKKTPHKKPTTTKATNTIAKTADTHQSPKHKKRNEAQATQHEDSITPSQKEASSSAKKLSETQPTKKSRLTLSVATSKNTRQEAPSQK